MKNLILAVCVMLSGCAVSEAVSDPDPSFRQFSSDVSYDVSEPDSQALPQDPPDACGLPLQCQPWSCAVIGEDAICIPRENANETCRTACGNQNASCPSVWEKTKCDKECAPFNNDNTSHSFCWAACHNATTTSCQVVIAQ